MTMATPTSVFLAAMKRRVANHPFDRISAYKIRECRDMGCQCAGITARGSLRRSDEAQAIRIINTGKRCWRPRQSAAAG